MDILIDNADDRELLVKLGSMVRGAASLEFALRTLASGLTGSPHGTLITSGEAVTRLIEMSRTLASAQPDTSEARTAALRDLLSRCATAFQRRDQYIHGMWLIDGETGEWSTMRSRRNKSEHQWGPADALDLGELATEMRQLYREIFAWRRAPRMEEILSMRPLIDEGDQVAPND